MASVSGGGAQKPIDVVRSCSAHTHTQHTTATQPLSLPRITPCFHLSENRHARAPPRAKASETQESAVEGQPPSPLLSARSRWLSLPASSAVLARAASSPLRSIRACRPPAVERSLTEKRLEGRVPASLCAARTAMAEVREVAGHRDPAPTARTRSRPPHPPPNNNKPQAQAPPARRRGRAAGSAAPDPLRGKDWMFDPTSGNMLQMDALRGVAYCPQTGYTRSLDGER